RTLFVVLKDGTIFPVEFFVEGKVVSRLAMAGPLAQTTAPTVVRQIMGEHLFIGSTVGASVLLKTARVDEEVVDEMDVDDVNAAPAAVVDSVNTMDMYDDEDIYGSSKPEPTPAANGVVESTVKKRSVIHLSLCDALPAWGSISDMTFSLARNGDRPVPELVAATGSGTQGGFTLFQRDLPIRTKRKIHAIGGARGVWSLPVRQAVRVNGVSYDLPTNPFHSGNDSVIMSTDANPSPGLSRLSVRSPRSDLSITTRIPGTTVGAAPFFQGTAILHVLSNAIRVLEPDGTERQIIKDMDGNNYRPKIKHCGICDPFVLILREDETIGLFIDACEYYGKRGEWECTTNYVDAAGCYERGTEEPMAHPLQAARRDGAVASLQSLLTDSLDPPALSLPQDPPRKPQDLDIDQVLIAPLGESSPDPHLFVFLRSGQLAIYSVLPSEAPSDPIPAARTALLKIKFVKMFSRGFDIQPHPDEQEKSTTFSGVFLTGDWPSWILATDKAGIKVHPSGHNVVHAFTACSLWESKGDFLLYTEEGPSLLEWMPGIDVGTDLPSRSVPKPRPYTNVVFDPTTCLVVAASSLQAQFGSFDEDGNQTWEPDASNVSYPTSECSALELFTPEGWLTLDGYEFANNEFVNDLVCVPLETQSTESGQKNFIAVGTTINRGEDLAVKGAIVEVVPDPSSGVKRWFKLRMRCKDDAKGPVTALCGIDGYLVSSMGQKIFVRALDMDERLVGVAFLDVGVYVTSLRAMKNLLLIGDAVKSVWLVAFQEDPYKLTVLSKDTQHHCVANADFFFTDRQLSIVTCDEEGVIRVYEYDPSDPESKNGQNLLLRTEFHGQVEYRSSVTVARRVKGEDMSVPQAKLLCGHTDGSLTSLLPVDESTFKRLQLLQGQLTRNVQHAAGLNPRAFRIVRNDFVSKPLSKGILDGNLLSSFNDLPITRQVEITRQIGTDRSLVLRDWASLIGPCFTLARRETPAMPFGEVVIGSPGSGKSTYCYGKHQLFTALNRPISVVNLDPANDNIPYPCAIDVASLITLQDAMNEHGLGPNGAMLYCMEYLEANYDWLEDRLRERREGRVRAVRPARAGRAEHEPREPQAHREAAREVRLSAVHLCDAHYVTDASKYVSMLLLSLRAMLHLALPHINVLSKVDLIKQYGDLDFNLDYYTEVQDLSYLENALNATSPRYAALNIAICGLVEDFGLVGFETLAVEDKHSMLNLTRVIDRATGYVYVPPPEAKVPEGAIPTPEAPGSQRPNVFGLMSSAIGQMQGTRTDVRDVQERWVDAREEWDAYERAQWRREGEIVRKEAEAAKKSKIRERFPVDSKT
ncbi:hypothetical protein EWM64_g8097, partial [Hericium alpestre]